MSTAFQATVTFAPELHGGGAASPSRWPDWMQRLLRPVRPLSSDAIDRSTGLYNRAGLFAAMMPLLDWSEGWAGALEAGSGDT